MGNPSLLRSRRRANLRRCLSLSDLQGGTAIENLFFILVRVPASFALTYHLADNGTYYPFPYHGSVSISTSGSYHFRNLSGQSLSGSWESFSSLLFAFLTVWEWDRVKRGQMEASPLFGCLSSNRLLYPFVVSYRYCWFNMEYHCSLSGCHLP